MRVIIAGSRTIRDFQLIVDAVLESQFIINTVISGGQRSYDTLNGQYYGADYFGEQWAKNNGVHLERYPADWNTHGKAAGPIRNKQMADIADALIAISENDSPGTKHMIKTMRDMNKPVYVRYTSDSSIHNFFK
jgi:hypothetical protein